MTLPARQLHLSANVSQARLSWFPLLLPVFPGFFPRKGSGTHGGSKLWRQEAETASPLKGKAWNWQSSHSLRLKGMGDMDLPPFGRSLKNLQLT